MEKIMVLLPKELYILRDFENQDLITDREEYSIYYKNLIYPYKEEYDVQISCQYGMNLGELWRISSFPEGVKEFPLTVSVFGSYGELLAEASATVKLLSKSLKKDIKLLCIGDSMTQVGQYIEQAADRVFGLKTLGLRSFGSVRHEGRGGYRCDQYFAEYDNKKCIGVSPFLFPKGVPAEKYYGCKQFYDTVRNGGNHKYWYRGFDDQPLIDGMLYYENGALINSTTGEIIPDPVFEFSFEKYLKRYSIETPDVVSILFGANEFQLCSYKELPEQREKYLSYIDAMVSSVKAADSKIKVIVNLPVLGSDQYAWGMRLGCQSSVKQFEYCIKTVCEALIERYDSRQSEGIYICPMLLSCSPKTGFRSMASAENLYTDIMVTHSNNWVHPCEVGYRQMGTALAGVIEEAVLDQ